MTNRRSLPTSETKWRGAFLHCTAFVDNALQYGDLKGHLCPSSQRGIYFLCEVKSEAFPQVKRSGTGALGDLKGHLCPSSQRGIHFLCEVKNIRKL
ncbi:hypothetical protein [Helicobacter valdiviensis]|uniref:hypothetical protein n=1 Tax=Helicobacter valdiviensis TaxID=1458358 RepID=UPI0015EC4206|nr:hypothetical protein [Helicobacter valdiviensis]